MVIFDNLMRFHKFKVKPAFMNNYFHSFINFNYSIFINSRHRINFASLYHHHTAWGSLFFDTKILDFLFWLEI